MEKAPRVIREELNEATEKKVQVSSSAFEGLDEFEETGVTTPRHKYPLPELPLASDANLKYRYDPIVQLVTNLMMKDGKLSVAQKVTRCLFWGLIIIGPLMHLFCLEHVLDTSASPDLALTLS